MKTELRVRLWHQVLSGLAALINYDALILEAERFTEILDFPFTCTGFDWNQVSSDIIAQVMSHFPSG